ncbi:Coiled-coil domain-containing protein 28B [Eumeta japonica]|uniref:Coiled-coil domain-containing protein 28B n=1 Tax=Eumeta variegata TaxID=151549 RepID=A0A4C1UU16_EUMVA|nr:Coiled-coil domain-containing protein 28B [Eumeta japonica]
MDLETEETNETQQLMTNDGEDEDHKVSQPATSPGASNRMSSGAASITNKNANQLLMATGNSNVNESSKVSFVNERRLHRDFMRSNYNNRPKNIPKETPDVKHMEKALLELLDDFHTGKLSAFGSGCSMEQMINIRDQQEHLARLHFRLCGDVEKPSDDKDTGFDNATAREKMAQLVHSLEQLSASIEHLHSGDNVNVK